VSAEGIGDATQLQISGDATPLPNPFDLLIVSKGMVFPARVVWRKGDLIGIAFHDKPRPL
jgi:hypothetical protein